MQRIRGDDAALAVLTDPAFMVPPVPLASAGITASATGCTRWASSLARSAAMSPVQACVPTAVLIERASHRPVDEVLRENPPVPATKRQALATTTVGDVTIQAGEVVLVCLAGDLAFGAGSHRCPGRAHALALVDQALTGDTP